MCATIAGYLPNKPQAAAGQDPMPQRPAVYWTDVKIERAWLAASAAFFWAGSAVMGAFSFTATPLFLIGAIPLFLFGAGCIGHAVWGFIDYDRPRELAAVRRRAESSTLGAILEEHGWDKLFQYSIVPPQKFNELYSAKVHSMALKAEMTEYEETKETLQKIKQRLAVNASFQIPCEGWREKLHAETKNLQYDRLKSYDLQKLIRYELITVGELKTSFDAFTQAVDLRTSIAEYKKISAILTDRPLIWERKLKEETSQFQYSLMRKYLLADLLSYSLITQEQLVGAFNLFGETAGLADIIAEYENIIACIPPSSSPQPDSPLKWKRKFHQESKEMTAEQIGKKYPVQKLKNYEIIEMDEYNILIRVSEAIGEHSCRVDLLHRELQSCVSDVERQLSVHTSAIERGCRVKIRHLDSVPLAEIYLGGVQHEQWTTGRRIAETGQNNSPQARSQRLGIHQDHAGRMTALTAAYEIGVAFQQTQIDEARATARREISQWEATSRAEILASKRSAAQQQCHMDAWLSDSLKGVNEDYSFFRTRLQSTAYFPQPLS